MKTFESSLPSNIPVIDDKNFKLFVDEADKDPNKGRGLKPRDWKRHPYAATGFAAAMPIPLIPESEYDGRIEQIEKDDAGLDHLMLGAGIPVKNQAQTNYCWINAPTWCAQIIREKQNQTYVSLSPASVGAKIKNFRNVGGWGTEGLQYGIEEGWSTTELWPDNGINKKYDTEEANAVRKDYKISEWWDLKPRNLAELYTCLLLGVPVAIGLNWWGHEVTAVRLIKKDGKYGILIANSWGEQWGDHGYGILMGSKQVPDDAVAPAVAIAA